jgi:hypothetical protein
MKRLNGQTAAFFVNSLGECIRNGNLVSTTIDCRELSEQNGFDWSVVSQLYTGKEKTALAKRWRATMAKAWDDMYRRQLTVKEYRFINRIVELQKVTEAPLDGRFRVYGEIRQSGAKAIELVTEFAALASDAEAWEKIDALAKRTNAMVDVMRDEDDGKQVEFAWRVEKLTLERFKAELAELRIKTAAVFLDYGNSVG